MSVFINDVPFRRIRGFWSQKAVLGGSGLGSGLLELLGLDFDFLGPPELGYGLLEPPGWILPPGDLRGGPPQMVINDFRNIEYLTSSHQRLINTELSQEQHQRQYQHSFQR